MNILGISAFYHDALFPKNAVEFFLKQGGINISDLDYVGFYDKPLQVVFWVC